MLDMRIGQLINYSYGSKYYKATVSAITMEKSLWYLIKKSKKQDLSLVKSY